VAIVGKMAADSAMKTVDAIAVESSLGVVKEISKDLAEDVGSQDAKSATLPAAAGPEVEVDAKAAITVNGVKPVTAGTTLPAKTVVSGNAPEDTNVTAVTLPTEKVSTEPVATNITQAKPGFMNGKLENNLKEATSVSTNATQIKGTSSKITATSTPGVSNSFSKTNTVRNPPGVVSGTSVVTSVAAVATSSEIISTKLSTAAPFTATSPVSIPPLTATPGTTLTGASAQELSSTLQTATTSAASVPDESLAQLHQSTNSASHFIVYMIPQGVFRADYACTELDSIREALYQRETLNVLHQSKPLVAISIFISSSSSQNHCI
jgi:hypothetical protein